MALYRQVHTQFWTDPKVLDDMTPEDRYFMLYLMTNPHVNQCGCYELSKRQMSNETGYTIEIVEKLLSRMETIHRVIRFDGESKELLIVNFSKYNWTCSPKVIRCILREIENVKTPDFRAFLLNECVKAGYPMDTLSIPYANPMDTETQEKEKEKEKEKKEEKEEEKPAADAAGGAGSDKPRKRAKKSDSELDLSFILDDSVRASFTEFIEHRKQIRKPMTQLAVEKAYKGLLRMYQDTGLQIAAIDNAIAKGWQGIYPLDNIKPMGGVPNGNRPDIGKFREDTALPF